MDYLNYAIKEMGLIELKDVEAKEYYIGRYEKEDPGNPDNIMKGILFLLWVIGSSYDNTFTESKDKGFSDEEIEKFWEKRNIFIEKYDKWNIF